MTIWYIVLLGVLIFLCIYYKVKIHFKSFFKRGFIAKRGPYGTRVYSGAQGKGKTLGCASFIYDNKDNIYLFSNVRFNTDMINYTYFSGFDGIIDIKNQLDDGLDTKGKQVVILFDELFTELTKGSKLTTDILDFLCQLRKRKIIFLTTCQSWADVPLQFRRLVRYLFKVNIITIPFVCSLHLITVQDAENMHWDDKEQDFIAPTCWTDLYKCRKEVARIYDTNQRITK